MEDDQADWPPRNRMSYIPEYIWVSDSLPMIPNLPIELAGEERGGEVMDLVSTWLRGVLLTPLL